MNNNQKNHPIGKFGEQIAMRFLEARGFCVLETNVHMRFGEIDIVAKDGAMTVFVEVKTRLSARHGGALHAFSRVKFFRFQKSALLYQKYKHLIGPYRLDFIAIQISSWNKKASIRHFRNVSWESFGMR